MRYEAQLAPRVKSVQREALVPEQVPRLDLRGIGAGPPDVVKISESEIMEPGSSSMSYSSQSKKSMEQKDNDSSKDTW